MAAVGGLLTTAARRARIARNCPPAHRAAEYATMPYREPLPDDCPPATAEEITEPRIVYRLVRNNPPTDDDFRSQRAENPQRHYKVPECQVRGLSVFSHYAVAVGWSNSRNLRGRLVCQATLDQQQVNDATDFADATIYDHLYV